MPEEYGLEEGACPHCGGKTRIEEHGALRWVCAACGGPRVPAPRLEGGTALARSGAEAKPLKNAQSSLHRAAAGRVAGIALLALAAALGGAGIYALGQAATMAIVLGACAVIALVTGLAQRAKAIAKEKEALGHVDEAWSRVAEDVLRASPRELTAAELAKVMRLEEGAAETILSSLAVHDRARIDVGADAELRYSPSVEAASDVAAEPEAAHAPGAGEAR